ncbi:hypothetical protein [Algoriphagus sanaruensis]|uniref:Lipoprotein n=1 Tax=Algoriphagus sanaruensis TaxID=1727163 RepID=A0A142EM19_9BACT|nr:hypothetical protein [Algoriphagus sanaruensis]AMQ56174.1 hypothetical protein AO498_07090 [Algoriphagus sanaruensis]
MFKVQVHRKFIVPIAFSFIISGCAKPSYCECVEISKEAISGSVGLPSNFDLDELEDCGQKVKEDIGLNLPADKIGIDFIQQVSYEMCNNGFYEGKHSDNRGRKYYPPQK